MTPWRSIKEQCIVHKGVPGELIKIYSPPLFFLKKKRGGGGGGANNAMSTVRSSISPVFVLHASSSKAFNKDGNTSFTPWLLRFFITAFAVSSAAYYTEQKKPQ